MSRTTLCLLTAGALAALSLTLMVVRHQVLGQEIRHPAGPGIFKVTMLLRGKSQGNAKVQMLCPLEFKQQHIFREEFASKELVDKPETVRGVVRRRCCACASCFERRKSWRDIPTSFGASLLREGRAIRNHAANSSQRAGVPVP